MSVMTRAVLWLNASRLPLGGISAHCELALKSGIRALQKHVSMSCHLPKTRLLRASRDICNSMHLATFPKFYPTEDRVPYPRLGERMLTLRPSARRWGVETCGLWKSCHVRYPYRFQPEGEMDSRMKDYRMNEAQTFHPEWARQSSVLMQIGEHTFSFPALGKKPHTRPISLWSNSSIHVPRASRRMREIDQAFRVLRNTLLPQLPIKRRHSTYNAVGVV